MPGCGPAPKRQRRNTADVPTRGEWQASVDVGWQHGPIPGPPDGIVQASREAWLIWMGSWFAAHWTPADLPGLRKVIQLYDATERSELHRAGELRQMMDNYGITPKGQQDRRWAPPKANERPAEAPPPAKGGRYKHLRAVG